MESGIRFLKPVDFNFGEKFKDIYVEVKEILKGDVIYECVRGCNYELVALTNARRINDGWYCIVENSKKEVLELFMSDLTSYPGPNLFREPRFITKVEKNNVIYIID